MQRYANVYFSIFTGFEFDNVLEVISGTGTIFEIPDSYRQEPWPQKFIIPDMLDIKANPVLATSLQHLIKNPTTKNAILNSNKGLKAEILKCLYSAICVYTSHPTSDLTFLIFCIII